MVRNKQKTWDSIKEEHDIELRSAQQIQEDDKQMERVNEIKMNRNRVGKENPRNENIKDMYPIPVSDKMSVERSKKYRGKYQDDLAEEVRRLAKFGLTNEEIAEFYEISTATFLRYQRDIPEFRDAITTGRMLDSMNVVDSLHKQALGYMVEEEETAEHVTRQGDIVVLKKTVKKFVQPSATAAIYLLKTRHGDKWMDIVRTESSKNLNITVKNVDFSDMSTEELLLLKKVGIKRIPEQFTGTRSNELPTQDVRGN